MAQQIKLSAPFIYAAIGKFTGITQDTLTRAIDGDKGAAAQVLKFREIQQVRAQNAETIYSSIGQGVQDLQQVIQAEAQFINQSGGAIKGIQNSMNTTHLSDRKLMNATAEGQQRHRFNLGNEQHRHGKTMSLMSEQQRVELRMMDIGDRSQRQALKETVRNAQTQLSPGQRALDNLAQLPNSSIGQGIGNTIGRVWRGIFG